MKMKTLIIKNSWKFINPNNKPVSQCDLEIYKGGELVLVIATERADNKGMSICNAIESLFSQVCEVFSLDPEKVIWVEHWPPRKEKEGDREKWHRVLFDIQNGQICEEPKWTNIMASSRKEMLEKLEIEIDGSRSD